MKKILCLIDTVGLGGGAERQMIGLVTFLRKRGYTVNLVVYHDDESYPEIKRRYGVEPIVLKVKNSPLSKLSAVRKHIRQTKGYDAVISYKKGANAISCILKMLGMKFKLIVSERNTTQVITRQTKILFWLYKYADFVVPNSYSQNSFIKEHFPYLKKKVTTITNFTDIGRFVPASINRQGDFRVLTVGRITKQKNTHNYIKAISLLKELGDSHIHFDWFGDPQCEADERYAEEANRLIKELEVADLFEFHHSTMNIVEQYQQCDVFCLPSNYEGFPNVICEAMSCGKPILCSRVCDNPYIVKEGENAFLFDNTSPKDIAEKILEVSKMDREALEKWGQKSKDIAETMFSATSFVEKYIKLIEA